jgi:hypothetical protein
MAHAAASLAQVQECIVECDSCHDLCLETIGQCLSVGGRHADGEHVTLLMDCAQICQIAADFMLRGSARQGMTSAVCAAVCEACASSCDALGSAELRACA